MSPHPAGGWLPLSAVDGVVAVSSLVAVSACAGAQGPQGRGCCRAPRLRGSTRKTVRVQPGGSAMSQAAASARRVRSRLAPLATTSTCRARAASQAVGRKSIGRAVPLHRPRPARRLRCQSVAKRGGVASAKLASPLGTGHYIARACARTRRARAVCGGAPAHGSCMRRPWACPPRRGAAHPVCPAAGSAASTAGGPRTAGASAPKSAAYLGFVSFGPSQKARAGLPAESQLWK